MDPASLQYMSLIYPKRTIFSYIGVVTFHISQIIEESINLNKENVPFLYFRHSLIRYLCLYAKFGVPLGTHLGLIHSQSCGLHK